MHLCHVSSNYMNSNLLFAVIDGAALRVDDRLRVAKERREEADRQQGKTTISVCMELVNVCNMYLAEIFWFKYLVIPGSSHWLVK